MQDHFQSTFDNAKSELYKSFKEIEDMPTVEFYNGLREIRTMFHDFKVKNDRYLRTSKKTATQAIGDVDDLSVAMAQENELYFNSSVRAAIQELVVELHGLTVNATAEDPTLTGLEKALDTFEKDYPLPSS
jgi:poly-beta-hydroxyalkanoate depolymerase